MSLRPNSREELRKRTHKPRIDPYQARRKREDELIHIRKQAREDNLSQIRRKTTQAMPMQPQQISNLAKMMENLPPMAAWIHSDGPTKQLKSTTYFRKLFSIQPRSPMDETIDAAFLGRLVSFLTRQNFSHLQLEAIWAVTKIMLWGSHHADILIHHQVIPNLVSLLNFSEQVRDQALWALGNITGYSASFRDLVLNHGALALIFTQINNQASLSFLRNSSWVLSNFCHGNPTPPFYNIDQVLLPLNYLIRLDDNEVLADVCWALSYLTDGGNYGIQGVIDAGFCPRLVELLGHSSPSVVMGALRTVGSIISGHVAQAQVMVDNQVLPRLYQILTSSERKDMKKEACWAISNITAGNKDQIQAVIDANIIPFLVYLLQNVDFDAVRALVNVTLGGSGDQIKYLVKEGCIKSMCDLLGYGDQRVVRACLEGVEHVLRAGEAEKEAQNTGGRKVNPYVQYVEHVQGLDQIESLQTHYTSEISEKAVQILETYWEEDQCDSEYEFLNS